MPSIFPHHLKKKKKKFPNLHFSENSPEAALLPEQMLKSAKHFSCNSCSLVSPFLSPGCQQSPTLAFLLSEISRKQCVFLAYFPPPIPPPNLITMMPQHGRKGALPLRALQTMELVRNALGGLQGFLTTKQFKTSRHLSRAGQVCLDTPASCTHCRTHLAFRFSLPSSCPLFS